jgi:hypothetical protein
VATGHCRAPVGLLYLVSHTVGDSLPHLSTSFRGRRLKDKLLAMLRIKSFFADPDSTFLHANDLGMGIKVYVLSNILPLQYVTVVGVGVLQPSIRGRIYKVFQEVNVKKS